MKNKKITPADVAEALGVSSDLVRLFLREGKFPFGTAVKHDERYSYIIFPERFRKYLEGSEMGVLSERG